LCDLLLLFLAQRDIFIQKFKNKKIEKIKIFISFLKKVLTIIWICDNIVSKTTFDW